MNANLRWVLILSCVMPAWSAPESAPVPNLAAAMARARAEQKLVMLSFTSLETNWCSACRNLDAEVSRSAEFLAYTSTNFVVVMIDDHSPQLAALEDKYDVGSWPTMLVLDTSGAALGRIAGYSKGAGWAKIEAELEKIRVRQ